MRIVSGTYRGRRFDVPHSFKARPTTDFAKENLFNVLVNKLDFDAGIRALDLFAGTGSITAELLSRGCQQVVSVERDRDHHAFITRVVRELGCTNCQVVKADVFKYLKHCDEQFDLVFADPPYELRELATIPQVVFDAGLLRHGGWLVLEHGKTYDFSEAPYFKEHRAYGSVNFSFFYFP